MIEGWYKNKILGDFAESICESHFSALGYDVEHTGIEKSAQMLAKFSNQTNQQSVAAKSILKVLHKTPDLLISRIYGNQLQSYMVEVKYRKSVANMNIFENELLWSYRSIIWNQNIYDNAGFSDDEKAIWGGDKIDHKLIEKVKFSKMAPKCINLHIIFYVVIKNPPQNHRHVYCNLSTYPAWWNAGDERFANLKNGTYKSNNRLHTYKDFNEVYFKEIEPALKLIFGQVLTP